MATLQTIKESLAPDLRLLDDLVRRQLSTSNKLMDNVMDHYLKTKGKMIRPIIVMLTARMFGSITPKVLSAAASVELLHNATLIHDDVVDQSLTRRGVPTINAIWDNHIAVLVGDYFVSSALQLAISTGDIRIIDSICFLGKQLSLGEIDQIYNARFHTITEEAYNQIIKYKTASLFVSCAQMGCYASGVDDERLTAMCRYAELLGLCFQIRDDIFDYYADESEIGKPTGNDLREGKITLPLIHALLHGDDVEMRNLSQKEQLTDHEIALLVEYAHRMGGIDYAYTKMERMRDEAVDIINKVFVDNAGKDNLIELFDYVIKRRS